MLLGLLIILACSEPSLMAEPVPGHAQNVSGRSDVDVAALARALEQGVRVIDVRTPAEYASGHVPGAISLPLDALDAAHPIISSHPKEEPLYVICHSGGRSARAADQLARAGYRAINILGGTADWRSQGHRLE
jgi:rhodanese-related sulfurtransferase